MTTITEDAQNLADLYQSAIKEIRIIFKDTKRDTCIVMPSATPVLVPGSRNLSTYQQDFGVFTERHRDLVQEVRVILKEGTGASQFFPRGTPETVIWASIIPKEELVA